MLGLARLRRPRRAPGRWAPAPGGGVRSRLSPPQLFALSFAALVAAGTVGLQLLPGLYAGPKLSWLDAAFTLTSAVCVTGLIVVDTATYFTPWGQAWLLLFIQLGGLGIVAFTSLIIVALGRRLSLRQESLSASPLTAAAGHVDERRLVRDVVLFTLVIEAAGAFVLWGLFLRRFDAAEALWHAVFHSVSAFCNAGFSTFSTSLIGYQGQPFVLAVIGALVVVGGLGFLTLEELYLWRKAAVRGARYRLSLHSTLVLATTAVLLVGGALALGGLEWDGLLRHLPQRDRVTNAAFLSVTARSAGFHTVDYALARDPTNFLTILLMFVGGSPGSVTGGVKTTTVALLALLAWSRLRGLPAVSVAGRTVPDETIGRATAVAMLSMTGVTLTVLALSAMEGSEADGPRFLAYMLEAMSSVNTGGLSMGVTPTLSEPSRLLVLVMMFVGRVGPITVAAAFARRRTVPAGFRYAHEDVVVG